MGYIYSSIAESDKCKKINFFFFKKKKKKLPNKLRQNDACLSLFAPKIKKYTYMPTFNQESECSTSSVTSSNTSAVDFYEAKVTELNLVHCV